MRYLTVAAVILSAAALPSPASAKAYQLWYSASAHREMAKVQPGDITGDMCVLPDGRMVTEVTTSGHSASGRNDVKLVGSVDKTECRYSPAAGMAPR